jgi:hypothetical protein
VYATQFVEWRYDHWKEMCDRTGLLLDPNLNAPGYHQRDKWVPAVPAFGSSAVRDHPYGVAFNCKHYSNLGGRTKVTTSTTTTFSAWVNLLGVNLSTAQTNSSSTSFTVIPKSGVQARYCLSGNDIFSSPLVEEVRQ